MRKAVAVLVLTLGAFAARAATFVVSNSADSGPGSLRQAVADANATPGPDAIDFSIGTGPQTIDVASPIVVTSPLTIDGATQEGFTGTPLITLFGSGSGNGLDFAAGADGSAVRNLELADFFGTGFFDAAAIVITGANNVSVTGNYFGGVRDFALRNLAGIRIFTSGNTIGGLTPAERNFFVNQSHDLHIQPSASSNVVRGNYFGFDTTGLVPYFPASIGIWIDGGSNNVIGGTEPGARNVVRTFSSNAVQITNGAAGNRVQGNYLGLRADGLSPGPLFPSGAGIGLFDSGGSNLIGGTTAAARNVVSNNNTGISIGGSAGIDFIHGNFVGTNPAGTAAIPNNTGVFVGSFGSSVPATIGGTGAGEGNLISGNSELGVYLSSAVAHLQGNFIGTDVTGLVALPNGGSGVHLQNDGAVIGTGTAAGRNVISGNAGDAIEGSALLFVAGNGVAGNYIGVGADGVTPLPNGGHGIALTDTFGVAPRIESNVIAHNGGSGVHLTAADAAAVGETVVTANRIFANQGDGVAIAGLILGNVVRANSIDGNGGLGIDLADDGVTPNDAGDADSGPNALQNFPVLTRAIGGSGSAVVTGTLSSTPATSFTIDFYASPAADPSGFGEGAQYLGAIAVVTDASGQATFATPVTGAAGAITSTATSAATGTSEFSNAVVVEAVGTLQFSSSTYATPEGSAVTITVTRTGGSAGTVTVDYATSNGTATAGQDYVPASGTLTLAEGQTTASFTVTALPDAASEPDETIRVTLSNATGGAAIGTPSQATITITAPAVAAIPTLSELALFALAAALALLALRSLRLG